MQHKRREACATTNDAARVNKCNNSLSPAAYKSEPGSVLHAKIINVLNEKTMKRNSIIPFPEVNRVLSWMFHCGKEDRQILISELECLGFVEVVPFHGLKILRRQA